MLDPDSSLRHILTTRPSFRVGLTMAIVAVCLFLVPYRVGSCGESPIYWVGFHLYECKYNEEAGDDFYCAEQIGDAWLPHLPFGLSGDECSIRKHMYFVPALYRALPFLAQVGH